jgi:hypothetical protein
MVVVMRTRRPQKTETWQVKPRRCLECPTPQPQASGWTGTGLLGAVMGEEEYGNDENAMELTQRAPKATGNKVLGPIRTQRRLGGREPLRIPLGDISKQFQALCLGKLLTNTGPRTSTWADAT